MAKNRKPAHNDPDSDELLRKLKESFGTSESAEKEESFEEETRSDDSFDQYLAELLGQQFSKKASEEESGYEDTSEATEGDVLEPETVYQKTIDLKSEELSLERTPVKEEPVRPESSNVEETIEFGQYVKESLEEGSEEAVEEKEENPNETEVLVPGELALEKETAEEAAPETSVQEEETPAEMRAEALPEEEDEEVSPDAEEEPAEEEPAEEAFTEELEDIEDADGWAAVPPEEAVSRIQEEAVKRPVTPVFTAEEPVEEPDEREAVMEETPTPEEVSETAEPSREPNGQETEDVDLPMVSELSTPKEKSENTEKKESSNISQVFYFSGLHKKTSNIRAKEEKIELSDDDIEDAIAFGYEREVSHLVDSERFHTIQRNRKGREDAATDSQTLAFSYRKSEYTSPQQIRTIALGYNRAKRKVLFRIWMMALMLLLSLLLSDPGFLLQGRTLAWHSIVLPLQPAVALALLVLMVFWSRFALQKGILSILRLEPNLYATVAFGVVMAGIYEILIIFFGGNHGYPFFNSMMAGLLLWVAIADWMRLQKEIETFRVVASRRKKFSLERQTPMKRKYRKNGKVVKIINDEKDERIYSVCQFSQTLNYFQNTGYYRSTLFVQITLITSLILAVVVFASSFLKTGSFLSAYANFAGSLLLLLPAYTLINRIYPLFSVSKNIGKFGCAIIGEKDVEEMAGKKTLIFNDKGFFVARNSTEITVNGGDDIQQYIRWSRYLFNTIGGTLTNLIDDSPEAGEKVPEVELTEIDQNGVLAVIDHSVQVVMGDSYYLIQHGIRVPSEKVEQSFERSNGSSLLYIAFNGKLRIGYELEYRMSRGFAKLVRHLKANQTGVTIRTYDPNLNNVFLERYYRKNKVAVGVVKPNRFESNEKPGNLEASLVATDSANRIAIPVIAAEQLYSLKKLQDVLNLFFYLGTVGLTVVLSLFHLWAYIPAVVLLGVQSALSLPVFFLTRKKIKYEELPANETENQHHS